MSPELNSEASSMSLMVSVTVCEVNLLPLHKATTPLVEYPHTGPAASVASPHSLDPAADRLPSADNTPIDNKPNKPF